MNVILAKTCRQGERLYAKALSSPSSGIAITAALFADKFSKMAFDRISGDIKEMPKERRVQALGALMAASTIMTTEKDIITREAKARQDTIKRNLE